jgi:hypothetical protein
MIRQTLMYYIDLYRFCENPEKAWLEISEKTKYLSQELILFD